MDKIIDLFKYFEMKGMDAIELELLEKAKRHFDIAVENIAVAEKILKELIQRGEKNEN